MFINRYVLACLAYMFFLTFRKQSHAIAAPNRLELLTLEQNVKGQASSSLKGPDIPMYNGYGFKAVFKFDAFNPKANQSANDSESLEQYLQNVESIALANPKSIVAKYASRGLRACGSDGPSTPFVPALRAAIASAPRLKKSDSQTLKEYQDLEQSAVVKLARRASTLTVELGMTEEQDMQKIVKEVVDLVDNYHEPLSDVLLMMTSTKSKEDAKMIKEMREAFKNHDGKKIYVHKGGQDKDVDLYIMATSSHLLASSPLVALSNEVGAVIASNVLRPYLEDHKFKWALGLDGGIPRAPSNWSESDKQLRSMGQVRPSCCTFEGYGVGDGEKTMCENALRKTLQKSPKCWVLSIGCQNKWSFERDVHAKTPCDIHVFDCTGDWTVPEEMRDRVFVHKYCVGAENRMDTIIQVMRPFRTIYNLIELGSQQSGFEQTTAPVIAKMDVEGYEIPALKQLIKEVMMKPKLKSLLPSQMLVEMHSTSGNMFKGIPKSLRHANGKYAKAEALVDEFFQNMTAIGYDLVHRVDNPWCKTCSEVTLVHRDSAPPIHL